MSSRMSHSVQALLDKMASPDADFRYMALSDLMAEARKDGFTSVDEKMESSTITKVLELIKDQNGEVKNMAVKCLGVLVKLVRDKQMQVILDKLVEYVSSKEEELRDIASLGLKTVIQEIPADTTLAIRASHSLTPRLLNQIADPAASQEVQVDSLDILADFFTRLSSQLANDLDLQKKALKILLTTFETNRAAVRKRVMLALGALGACSTSDVFTSLAEFIATTLSRSSANVDISRTIVQLLGSLAKLCPRRLGRRLPEFMPRILNILTSEKAQEEDELRESSLQTIESIVLRCPTEVTPFVTQIVEIAITLLKHDPNYAGGNESDEDMTTDDDDNDEDDDLVDEDDYSDDDDLSWKVRRGAAKLLATVFSTRTELLVTLIPVVAPPLVMRFSEREESVRLEVLQTFMVLLRQVQIYGGGPQATEVMRQSPGALKRKWDEEEAMQAAVALEGSPVNQIRALEPAIAMAVSKELTSKSMPTRFSSYAVLRELMVVLRGGLDTHVGLLLDQTQKALKGTDSMTGPSSNLKAEVLSFLQLLFRFHSPSLYEGHLDQLVPLIVSIINDRLHRDTMEGLNVSSELVRALRPLKDVIDTNGRYKKHLIELYNATQSRVQKTDSDQETKERAIATLGVLLAHAGDDLLEKYDEGLPLILDRISNEVTRLAAVKVIERIASSPVCKGPQIDQFSITATEQVAFLLRKNNRMLRMAAFDCLASLITRLGISLPEQSAVIVVREIEPLLAHDSNLSLIPVALRDINLIVSSRRAISDIEVSILPHIYSLVRSPILQGVAMDSILTFLMHLLTLDPSKAPQIVAALLATIETKQNQVQHYSAVAQCIGAVSKAVPKTADEVVKRVEEVLAKGKDLLEIYFNLLLVGEVGRIKDLGGNKILYNKILSYYEAPSEEVRSAAAFAIGNMSVGNPQVFLPVIEGQVKNETAKMQLLSLQALKEVISHGSAEQLKLVAERIWAPLFEISATKNEAIQNLGAECLARLTLTQPAQYLPLLQSRIQDPTPSTRASVIAAIRYTLTETRGAFDNLLASLIVDFLSLVKDESLEVRKHAIFAFNAAAHNRPGLIRGHLGTLLPMLYQETVPRPELLRKVVMGPFTVTTDDGLDLRKNAFETMYTLLDTCFSRINLSEYIARVIAGLKDEDGIKVLSCLMLIRLASVAPVQIAQHLDEVVEPIASTIKVKLKEGSTKQEVEKSTELQRSLFRAMLALDKTPHAAPKFQALIRDAKAGSPLFRDVELAYASNSNGVDRMGAMDVDSV